MLKTIQKALSSDGSIKFIFENLKHHQFEAIYYRLPPKNGIPYDRYHVCISTQAGCAMGCTFCSTGYGGFFSQILPEEMEEQIEILRNYIITNGIEGKNTGFSAVLMGMGEPLANLQNVSEFCLSAKKNMSSIEKIAISTIGIAPNIVKLIPIANKTQMIRLFLSIHSPYNSERSKIMPLTLRYKISDIISSAIEYSKETKSKVTASYLILDGVNDSEQHAFDFAELLDPEFFDVQLLLYNETKGVPFKRPSIEKGRLFEKVIASKGLDCILRLSKGQDIDGGCGQFVQKIKKKGCEVLS